MFYESFFCFTLNMRGWYIDEGDNANSNGPDRNVDEEA